MRSRTWKQQLCVAAIVCLACATVVMAQVKTQVTEHTGAASKEATVERGEVVFVSGNDLVIRMESGEIRHFTVPDGASATVNGKVLTLADLKPGMKLERTITTTTRPKTIKTVKSVTGTVVMVMPPNAVTLRLEDGTAQGFKIPKGQKFNIDGKELTAFELKKGMKVTATKITEEPAIEISSSKQVTGAVAPPPPPPPDAPILIAETPSAPLPAAPAAKPAPAPAPVAEAAAEPKKLPSTGSVVPLIGILGLLFSGASFGLRLLRR